MKKFIKKTLTFLLVAFLSVELLCRIFIDPIYFYKIDTYNVKNTHLSRTRKFIQAYTSKKTRHVDYLFIGSSRVPATINPGLIMQQDSGKIAVVAGRGYMTQGVHYQALKNRIKEYPEYLNNARVFIEYSGSSVYAEPFSENEFLVYEPLLKTDKAMPHLLLPHLNFKSFLKFIKVSDNSAKVKMEMFFLYCSSFYRSISFVKETLKKLDTPLFNNSNDLLVSEGGIRNDAIEFAQKAAITYGEIVKERLEKTPPLTIESLNNSTLAKINELVQENGGKLFLYKIPLHSLQQVLYNTDKEKNNQRLFEEWLDQNGIGIISCSDFEYNDEDFPDTWHLSMERRDEFTQDLYEELKQ